MAKKIAISGIIANFEMENESNVTPATLRKSLEDANGEDLLITINSPGGSVFAGLEMFSLIQNYPGQTETRVVSLAASMGSVLALAGDKKSIENTALFFIHNAQGIGIGDHRDLANEAEFLRDISILIANLYAEFTTLSLDEALAFMDDDSHFFGAELELLGFEVAKAGSEPNESTARVNARMKFQEARAKITDEKYSDDIEQAAASIDYKKFGIKNSVKKPVTQPPASAGTTQKVEAKMDLTALLAADPEAQAQYDANLKAHGDKQFAAGETAGKEAGKAEGKAEVKAVYDVAIPILSSAHYPEAVKNRVTEKAQAGDVEAVKDYVSMYDMTSEGIATAKAIEEAGEETPPAGPQSDAEKTESDFQARLAKQGGA